MTSRRRFAVALVALCGVSAASSARAWAAESAPVMLGPWSSAERVLVAAALARLPASIREHAPPRILRDRSKCEPDGLPHDDELFDARGDAHLCAPSKAASGLDLGRQVVLVSLLAFDRAAGWSDDPAWRRLNSWQRSIAHPFDARPDNRHEAGFVAPRGWRSPRWDLAAFAAALLLDDTEGDDAVGCRLISQAAFVRDRLARMQDADGVVGPARCEAFQRWADLNHLADVEVVLATPSTTSAASVFGHVFLRLVYRDDDGDVPLHRSWSVSFLADNDVPFAAERHYAMKGIAGFYTASLHERTFLEAYREYAVLEGRDLRRWRVNLTATERRQLLQRLWTVKGAGRYTYYFFRRNCATLMLELVAQIRSSGAPIDPPGLLAAPPASLLEPWARARGADGERLLQFVAEPLWSFDHQARLASRRRRAREERIVAALAGSSAAALRETFEATHAPAPEARAAAYAGLVAQLRDRAAGTDADVRAWLSDSAAIESPSPRLPTWMRRRAPTRSDTTSSRAPSPGSAICCRSKLERCVPATATLSTPPCAWCAPTTRTIECAATVLSSS